MIGDRLLDVPPCVIDSTGHASGVCNGVGESGSVAPQRVPDCRESDGAICRRARGLPIAAVCSKALWLMELLDSDYRSS